MFNENSSLELPYRWSAAVTAMAGSNFQMGMAAFGYSYDLKPELNNYNSSSHGEFFLTLQII
jgi:hypothetical protein